MKQQPTTMTPFYELAQRIAEDIKYLHWCCVLLNSDDAKYLKEYFEPSYNEKIEFDMLFIGWFGCQHDTIEQDNNFRIVALLFCHEHYLTYKNLPE